LSGSVIAETDTRSAATAETLRLLVDEFGRLQLEPVHPAELRGAQDFLAGNFPLTIETPGAIAQQVLAHLFYGLDPGEIETYRERVEKATTMDIQRVARELLKPDRLSVVLVGDAATFASQLKAAGFAEVERIPIGELDLSSPTLRRAARQPDSAPQVR
jgi:zinc protease